MRCSYIDVGMHKCNNGRASETLSGVYIFELVRYMYICMVVREANAYVMRAELGQSHFFVCTNRFKRCVTNENGAGIKKS